jgi:hypothetical protein
MLQPAPACLQSQARGPTALAPLLLWPLPPNALLGWSLLRPSPLRPSPLELLRLAPPPLSETRASGEVGAAR